MSKAWLDKYEQDENIIKLEFEAKVKNWSTIWQTNKLSFLGILLPLMIFILYYVSGFLSFGRATWIGTSMAIAYLLYFLYVKNIAHQYSLKID